MTRSIGASELAKLQAEHFNACTMVRIDFTAAPLLLTTNVRDIDYNSETYQAIGDLGGVSTIEEGTELQMYGAELTLSGIDSALISNALTDNYQGDRIDIYMAILDDDFDLIGTPILLNRYRLDSMSIDLGKTGTITATAESVLSAWDRPNVLRYNQETQHAIDDGAYSADVGLESVEAMTDKPIIWSPVNDYHDR